MNTIEQLVDALNNSRPHKENFSGFDEFYAACDKHDEAIAAGEAELKREPVAWMDKHGNIERGWDAILNPNEFTPLYTRGEA